MIRYRSLKSNELAKKEGHSCLTELSRRNFINKEETCEKQESVNFIFALAKPNIGLGFLYLSWDLTYGMTSF